MDWLQADEAEELCRELKRRIELRKVCHNCKQRTAMSHRAADVCERCERSRVSLVASKGQGQEATHLSHLFSVRSK